MADMTEPTLHDVIARLDKIDGRLDSIDARMNGLDQHVESLCKRVSTLERTVCRWFAAMGAGFRVMSDQLSDS